MESTKHHKTSNKQETIKGDNKNNQKGDIKKIRQEVRLLEEMITQTQNITYLKVFDA